MGKLKEVDNLGRSKYKGSCTEIFVEILVYEVDNLGCSKYKRNFAEFFVRKNPQIKRICWDLLTLIKLYSQTVTFCMLIKTKN